MSRLAAAYDRQISATEPGRRFRLNFGFPGTQSAVKRRASIRAFATPLKRLKRAFGRSAFAPTRSRATTIVNTSNGNQSTSGAATFRNSTTAFTGGSIVEAMQESNVPSLERAYVESGRPIVAFIGASDARGGALEFVTREAARRGADLVEFHSVGELLEHLQRGHTCDLALLDWDSLGHKAFQSIQQCPAVTSQIAFVVMTGPSEAAATNCAPETTSNLDDGECSVAGSLPPDDRMNPVQPSMQTLEQGPLKLDFRAGRAFWKGCPVELTVTQFNIVHLFARHIGENLTYRQIYDVVHKPGFHAGDGEDGYQTNVRSLIKRIRQQFRAADNGFVEIENHRGVGYRWRIVDWSAVENTSAHLDDRAMDDDKLFNARSRWLRFVDAASGTRRASPAASPADNLALVTDPLR
jgi:two-component system response regulator ChvI